MKYRIEVSLKSFEHDLLVRATDQIQHLIGRSRLEPAKIFYFPTHFQKFTVLRSPHIDKKARDQFEIRRFKNILSFDIDSSLESRSFLENLKNIHCTGTQVKIRISSMSYGPKKSEKVLNS